MKAIVDLANKEYIEDFISAEPYQHIVFDNFFTQEVSDRLFQGTKEIKKWINTHVYKEKKNIENRMVADYSELSGCLKEAIDYLYGEEVIDFISKAVGVPVFRDPNSLRGGGLQRAANGAYLNVHLDNCWHPKIESWTVANCLYYLSTDWKNEYGGHLELWKDNQCYKKISPVRNRCVFCINNDVSYHGYPKKITAPEGKFRQALVLFYYSKQPVKNIQKRDSALWK